MSYCRTGCNHGKSDVYVILCGCLFEIMVSCIVEHRVKDKRYIGAVLFSGSHRECVRQLIMLKRLGYVVPQHAIVRLLEEQNELDVNRAKRKIRRLQRTWKSFRPLYREPEYHNGRYR